MKKLALLMLVCLTVIGVSLEEAAALGENNEELVYTPLTPCRLIDTRNAVGDFAGGETRNYNLIGPAGYAGYGGNAAGCGIPVEYISGDCSGMFCIWSRTNRVRALVLNVVAVSPQNNGHLRAWPTNEAMPGSSILNYAKVSDETNPSAQLNIANGLVLKTCGAGCSILPCTPCASGDLSFYSSGISHLLVDVIGYMTDSTPTYHDEGLQSTGTSLSDGACHEITSCSVTNNTPINKSLLVIATANAQISHTEGTHDEIITTISDTTATCDTGQASVNSGKFEVHSLHPSGCCMEGTIAVSKKYVVYGGNSATYYLNARALMGASANDYILNATLQCILLP